MFFSMICRLGAKYMNLISGKLILHILHPNIHSDSAQSAVFQSDIEASCSIELYFVGIDSHTCEFENHHDLGPMKDGPMKDAS
jgi:hypothetical protein